MAFPGDPSHIARLHKGTREWNEWRRQNPTVQPDLNWVKFVDAGFHGMNFTKVRLIHAYFYLTSFWDTDFTQANMVCTSFIHADFQRANFEGVILQNTAFAGVDFQEARGLELANHSGPSHISFSTLTRSRGAIPEVFLRGCGLTDWEIEFAKLYVPEQSSSKINDILYRIHSLRASQPIQISPLFISYSHADTDFVDRLEKHLEKSHIRFWRDVRHAVAGRLETQVDQAIRLNPTVLLVLSQNSVESDWVQHECRLARRLELESKRDVLCPIALDDSWKTCAWPQRLREQLMEYNILDFSGFDDDEVLGSKFDQLYRGLHLFYRSNS